MYVRKTGKAMQGMWKNSECGKTVNHKKRMNGQVCICEQSKQVSC